MKIVKRLFIVLVVLLVVIVLTVNFFLGDIVKGAVETVGPKVMGVPITLADADVRLARGYVHLEELIVGNPEGYKTPYLFKMGELKIQVKVKSVTSDTIIIEDILVSGPEIIYEKGLTTSNIGALMKQLEGEPKEEAEKEAEADEESAEGPSQPGKKVVIEHFLLEKTRVKVSATLAGGKSISIPLPPIELNDIGKEKEGASITEVISEIFGAIFKSVGKALSASVELVGKGVVMAGDAALEGAEMAGKAAMATGEAAVDGAKVVGGAAADGAKAVGGVATDGAKAVGSGAMKVGGAVADGASKVFGGVKGLVTSEEEKIEEEE